MCGIAGIISFQNNFNVLKWLNDVSLILKHRGNDDDGITLFDFQNTDCSSIEHFHLLASKNSPLQYLKLTPLSFLHSKKYHAGFIHRRLSILDLSEQGHQPMCNNSGSVWITYNGEIYNYLELKKSLLNKGYQFFTNTDTEVVLNCYLHYGKDFLQYLNGMWAFCIYDKRTNEWILSRDRLGVKPLYYYHSKNIFAFASEQKTFIKSHLLPFSVNYQALSRYLIDTVLEDEEESIFQSIKELQPGEIMILDTHSLNLQKRKYFNLDAQLTKSFNNLSEQSIISQTREKVESSIQQHLKSDVDVAISLSGGIDSSVIAVTASRYSSQPLNTFSIVFPSHSDIDETSYINTINQTIHCHPHNILPNANDFFSSLDELLYSQDLPIWSTSTYNQFLLMKNVKEAGIKVILSGQGSDELFAGYQHHYVAYWLSLLKKIQIVHFFRHLHQSSHYLPSSSFHLFTKALIKNTFPIQKLHYYKYLSNDILKQYNNTNIHNISSHLNVELLRDLSFRRLKAFLKCEDRCSMWHSVESRLPFSDDINLITWSLSIPENLKLKNGISKYILREAFKETLPAQIYQRKDKKAFDAPLKEWLILREKEIWNEIKNGWQDIINPRTFHKITSLQSLSNKEIQIIFKLFLLNRWKQLWQ